jgi:putative effector of murein hydrolase
MTGKGLIITFRKFALICRRCLRRANRRFRTVFGESMLYWMPLRSAVARSSMFGMGAHGAGSSKAHQINPDEGAIAGLVMVLAGIFNVLAGPLLAHILR